MPKKIKHKTKTAVLDKALQAKCLCGFEGTVLSTQSGLPGAIEAAQVERDTHIKGLTSGN